MRLQVLVIRVTVPPIQITITQVLLRRIQRTRLITIPLTIIQITMVTIIGTGGLRSHLPGPGLGTAVDIILTATVVITAILTGSIRTPAITANIRTPAAITTALGQVLMALIEAVLTLALRPALMAPTVLRAAT